MRALKRGVCALAIVGGFLPASAEVLPRGSVADGAVVDRKSGEEIRFIEVQNWRGVEVDQDLIAGDTLRTNAVGSLAIRFSDNTLVRMAREKAVLFRTFMARVPSQDFSPTDVLPWTPGRPPVLRALGRSRAAGVPLRASRSRRLECNRFGPV